MSENEFIDEFIQQKQLNSDNPATKIEWIPFNKLEDVTFLDNGGFMPC